MSDMYCVHCGEPWESYFVLTEMREELGGRMQQEFIKGDASVEEEKAQEAQEGAPETPPEEQPQEEVAPEDNPS